MTNRQKYILDQDDDGHWYLFPAEKLTEFDNWIKIQYGEDYEDPAYGKQPEWLQDLGTHPRNYTFENPEER